MATASQRPVFYHLAPQQWYSTEGTPEGLLKVSGSQALCVAEPGDIVFQPEGLRRVTPQILAFLASKGLPVVDGDGLQWGTVPQELPSGFRYHPLAYNRIFAPLNFRHTERAHRWADILQLTGDKNAFDRYCREHGFSSQLPDTWCFNVGELPTEEHYAQWFDGDSNEPMWFKLSAEVWSRHYIFPCTTREEAERAIREIGHAPYQVQAHAPGKPSTVSYEGWNGELLAHGMNYQILVGGTDHAGNYVNSDVPQGQNDDADALARHLVEMGLEGTFGFNLHAGINIDPNLRWMGSHLPWKLMDKVNRHRLRLNPAAAPLTEFRYQSLKARGNTTVPELLSRLDDSGYAPDALTGEGVWPAELGKLEFNGSVALVAFGPNAEQAMATVREHCGLALPAKS